MLQFGLRFLRSAETQHQTSAERTDYFGYPFEAALGLLAEWLEPVALTLEATFCRAVLYVGLMPYHKGRLNTTLDVFEPSAKAWRTVVRRRPTNSCLLGSATSTGQIVGSSIFPFAPSVSQPLL